MPILDDIMDHEVLGRERKRGIELGREEGRTEGERSLIVTQLAKRFGPVPDWAQKRLDSLSACELDTIGLRLLDARTLEDLFK